MLKKLIASLFTVALIVGAFAPVSLAAGYNGKQFKYKSLFIEIAPEFSQPADWPADEPSMIFYQKATLTNNSGGSYDGTIEIPVPAKMKNFRLLQVVEFAKEDQSLQEGTDIKATVDSERQVISFKPSKAIKSGKDYYFAVSTIVNPFEDNSVKSFTFEYTPVSDGEEVDISIYAPIGAKDISVEPKGTEKALENGETVYQYHLHDEMKAGKKLTYKVSYTKADNKTTEEQGGSGTDTDSSNTNTSSSTSSSDNTAIIIALIIGLSIVIFGVFLFLGLRGRGQGTAPASAAKQKAAKQGQPSKKQEENSVGNVEAVKKQLRKQLLAGEIDEKQYNKEMKKLN